MNLFIIGEPLLKNLYTVYDFDNEAIMLGVNIDATDKIMIYSPGKRPPPPEDESIVLARAI
jgi:hypothetical protein